MILLIGGIIAFMIFVLIFMSIIEGIIRSKRNEKIVYKIDKVETLTGGLENDRLNEKK